MASRSVILEAPDEACGYLSGMKQAPFGCNASEQCAIYYPTSSMAAPATMLPMITPAPQPSVVCCEPSRGDCTVQPTTCVDISGDCAGTCSNDPMTLKCTAGANIRCNRAHFESPLSFRNIGPMHSGLRHTDAPADGWFCGGVATSFQQVDAWHSKAMSMAHVSHSPFSLATTLGVTITLSRPGLRLGPSVSPSTTLGVTITLSKPGQTPGASPMPPPPAAVVSEDIDCEDDTPGGEDCCFDERDAAEPCYNEARRARLQRRQATGGSTTAASPVAAPEDVIGRGSAIVSTAYIGQTDRPPLVEATRPWNVVVPTATTTSKTTTADPEIPRFPRKNRLNIRRITIGAVCGGLVMIAIVCFVWRKLVHRLCSRRQRVSTQDQNGHELAEHPEHVSKRREEYLQKIKNLGSIADRVVDVLGSGQISPDYGDTRGQSEPVFE
ncbi:hypothetical protein F5883DRAFT_552140 [Diaporthe sp. PMI_573]|nr:hypothetical protein F5883DRAFT_552140 [Diaporthaceae sp. PMI_573]